MEDHFILRAPPALAARLRRVLAEDASSVADASSLQLEFSEDGRTGQLHIGADVFPAKLLDLPTKVESWKSLDDVNLVKSADIGQIIVVSPPGGSLPTEDVSVNGVTVALRCVSATMLDRSCVTGALVLADCPLPPQRRAAHPVPSPA